MDSRRAKLRWLALGCLVLPMFGSYFFDDMFSTVSHLFEHPEKLELGWNIADLGNFIGDYSLLCVCGGLIIGGILLDIFGIRKMGSVFVGMMAAGAALAYVGVSSDLPHDSAIAIGRTGRMLFGLGSEIAGVAVTRSIAKWFSESHMSLAMSLQLAIARAGTAIALLAAPFIVGIPRDFYSKADTARPALIGLVLVLVGLAAWGIFVLMDERKDRQDGVKFSKGEVSDENKFSFRDILQLLRNPQFVMISLLCVSFYCCVSSFKKFGTAVVIPRFGIKDGVAGTMMAMIPFCTIVFTPLFGALVDKVGKATRWMILGAAAVLSGHLILLLAPQGIAVWGYVGIALLGLGYSLVPSAMWPSIARIVPSKSLGTAYSLTYWIQNIGLFFVPKIIGRIFSAADGLAAASKVETLFVCLGTAAVLLSVILRLTASHKKELGI